MFKMRNMAGYCYEISNDCIENYGAFTAFIDEYNMSPEEAVCLLLNYHGMQLLTADFMRHILRDADFEEVDEEEEDD